MPLILRAILQRLFAFTLSILAFFGISPEVNVLTEKQADIAQEERDESIENYFETAEKEQEKTETQKSITEPVVEKPKETIPAPTIVPETKPIIPTLPEIVNETKDLFQENFVSNIQGAENTLVNIMCLHREEGRIEAHSGSGVLIDSRGVVITNAHVAQFFLLEDSSNENYMDCNLYKENIPTYGYTAKLLYISPKWIQKNYSQIRDGNPIGTGEDDFAFIYITGNTNPTLKNPNDFPFAYFSTNFKYKVGTKITVAGYPGAPTNINDLAKSVKLKTDSTYISDVFTLEDNSIDVISTGPTELAQRGASGGGLFKEDNLIAITSTLSDSSEGKKINAITTSYINRSMGNSEKFNVVDLLNTKDLMSVVNNFYEKEVPDMKKLLMRAY